MKRIISKYAEYLISVSMLLIWLIPYLLIKEGKNHLVIENIFLITIGLVVSILLIFNKNTYYPLSIILFVPFIFAHPFDAISIPITLYIIVGMVVISMIIHFIRFKPKMKRPKLLFGLIIFAISLILGGITIKSEHLLKQILVMSFATIGLLIILLFFNSTIKDMTFQQVAKLMCILNSFLLIQLFIGLAQIDGFKIYNFYNYGVDVGWGNKNNISVILLMTFPFGFYYMFDKKHPIKHTLIGYLLTTISYLSILLGNSRGAFMVASFGMIAAYIVIFIFYFVSKDKLRLITFSSLILSSLIVVGITLLVINSKVGLINVINNYLDKIHMDNLNGRSYIYKYVFEAIRDDVVFGKGMFSGFTDRIDVPEGEFQWCHSTLLQAIYSGGIVGLIAILIHLFEKYFYLIKNMSIEKLVLIASFALSGIYGLFDVSYYFICYMVVIMIIFVLTDFIYQDKTTSIVKQFKEKGVVIK